MSMRLAFLAPLVMITLLVSGCTDFCIPPFCQGTSYTDDVIVIKDLNAIPNKISNGQSTTLIVYVQNLGNAAIPLSTGGTHIKEESNKVKVNLYDYCQGVYEIADVHGCDSLLNEDTVCEIGKIQPGEIKQVRWNLKSNKDIKIQTVCPSDGLKVRVEYPYTTNSVTTVSFMNSEEMQRQLEQGTLQRDSSYITTGYGPLKPYLTVEDEQPISTDAGTTVFALQIKNEGDGFVKESEISRDQIDIDSSHDMPGGLKSQLMSCLDDWTKDGPIPIIDKKTAKLPCQINIPEDIAKQLSQSYYIEVTINDYIYEFRDKEKVTIEPTF